MDVVRLEDEDKITLKVSGRLDTTTAASFDSELDKALGLAPKSLILDFEGLEYTSSAGLRVILKAQKEMNKSGGTMKIIGVCDPIKEVFAMTGFSDIIDIE